jgi:hypothetical protein
MIEDELDFFSRYRTCERSSDSSWRITRFNFLSRAVANNIYRIRDMNNGKNNYSYSSYVRGSMHTSNYKSLRLSSYSQPAAQQQELPARDLKKRNALQIRACPMHLRHQTLIIRHWRTARGWHGVEGSQAFAGYVMKWKQTGRGLKLDVAWRSLGSPSIREGTISFMTS